MENARLKISIVGVGMWSLEDHIPSLRSSKSAELVAICRRDRNLLRRSQQTLGVPRAYTDWRQMLANENLDAVVVATPHHAHVEPVLDALDRGLHVLVEKPLAISPPEAWRVVHKAEATDRVCAVAYPYRCQSEWRDVKHAIDVGMIGRIRQVVISIWSDYRYITRDSEYPAPLAMRMSRSEFDHDITQSAMAWRSDLSKTGGGMFVFKCSHLLDLVCWIAGSAASRVVGFNDPDGLDSDCFFAVQSELRSGIIVSVASAAHVERSNGAQIIFIGDAGVITGLWSPPHKPRVEMSVRGTHQSVPKVSTGNSPMLEFIRMIEDGTGSLASAREGAELVDFIDAAYRSSRNGKIVALPSVAES